MAPVHSAASTQVPSSGAPPSGAPLVEFERALEFLSITQRRILRCLLTGASLPLIAGIFAVDPRDIEEWLVEGGALHRAITALHRALPFPLCARLRVGITNELRALDGSPHEPAARATLAIVRAVGRLDAELRLLDHSPLRRDGWSVGAP